MTDNPSARVSWRPETIASALERHQPGTDGRCVACAQVGIVTTHPCGVVEWAREQQDRLIRPAGP